MEEQLQHRTGAPGRLRFVLGSQTRDVALPVEVPLGDVLPAVLSGFGTDAVEQGSGHQGYVVQRLGEHPLDEELTPAQLDLLDGETLYLRPRADKFEPIDYDDLVDGVAEQVRTHSGTWTPQRSRWMLTLGGAAVWLVGLVAVLLPETPSASAAIAGAAAVVLLIGAGVVARAAANSLTAVVLAGVAAAYAAVACGLGVGVIAPISSWMVRGAGAGLGALVALFIGVVLVADGAALFTGALTALLLVDVPLFVGATTPLTAPEAAGIGIVVTLVAGLFIPGLGFRLGGMTLPLLPSNSDELREDIDPVPHEIVVDRGKAAIGYLNALHIGSGLAQSAQLLIFASAGGAFALALNAVLVPLLLMRAKHLDGAVQRWAALTPAGVAFFTLTMRLTGIWSDMPGVLGVWVGMALAGVGLMLASERLPGKRLRPYWGRAVDIFELLTAVAVLPLLLGVLDVYRLIRGLGG
ncbi:type VII secretion integral membrane protein EccD [Amycolatopsis sp. NPDC049868]|uniref:type VII secretion integral membrane protein EccD n=1 Tax=Amycolatopsis sp. NPDC049868 TaxID=3363934 RepID=UPI0037ACDC33